MSCFLIAATTRSADVAFAALEHALRGARAGANHAPGRWAGAFDSSTVERTILTHHTPNVDGQPDPVIVELVRSADRPVLVDSDDPSVLEGLARRGDLDDLTRQRVLTSTIRRVRQIALSCQPLALSDVTDADLMSAAPNRHLPDELRTRLVRSSKLHERRAVAQNPALTVDEVEILAGDHRTLPDVLGNVAVDPAVLFPRVRGPRTAEIVAGHPLVSGVADRLLDMARPRWPDVLAALVVNDHAPTPLRADAFRARSDARDATLTAFGLSVLWHRDGRAGTQVPAELADALFSYPSAWVLPLSAEVHVAWAVPSRPSRRKYDATVAVLPDGTLAEFSEDLEGAQAALSARRDGPLGTRDRVAAIVAGVEDDSALLPAAYELASSWTGGYQDLVDTIAALRT